MAEPVQDSTTEEKILQAAEIEFLETGLAGARMQNIANRAGMNKALLHYYFRTKDRLFEVVFTWKINQFLPQVNEVLHDEHFTFIEKMERFVQAYLTMLRKNPFLPVLIISTLHRNPEFAKHINHQLGKEFTGLMKVEIAAGRIRPVDAHQFLLSVLGMCVFPFVGRPIFSHVFDISAAEYDRLLAERHLHVMQYVRAILTP